ncbi:MAG: hypothetical protein NTW50_04870 [Candidatus Berkelbacteria bacterium]|nr:hypothetical protein [Candidatus Berkelbacteria bacterium]
MDDPIKIQQDIDSLNALVRSYEEENKALMQTLIDVKERIDAATADDMKIVKDSASELDNLEEQADEEETQGAIQSTQGQISSM